MNIQVTGLSKRYLRKTGTANFFYAVESVDGILPEKALTVLTGRSGSGKTTFLQMIGGLLEPSTGKVQAGDTDLYSLADPSLSKFRNAHIGVIPQGHATVHSLTVLENITLPRMLYQIDPENAEKDALALMETLEIQSLRDVLPKELSGGELRRMSIARAIINHPDILLADEPTGDLDEENSRHVLELFRSLADAGMNVLLVTHELDSLQYADQVWRMDAGKMHIE